MGFGGLCPNAGFGGPGSAPGNPDVGAMLRWRFRPNLGIGALPEETEKDRNDKKRACQKEHKQQPQQPPCMKEIHDSSFVKTISTTIPGHS